MYNRDVESPASYNNMKLFDDNKLQLLVISFYKLD